MVGGKHRNFSGGYVKKLKKKKSGFSLIRVHICPLQVQFDKLS